MSDFIPPLEMKTWIVQFLSGTPIIFTAVALIFITSLAGYFRMNIFGMFVMLAIFAFMFIDVIPFSLITLIAIFGGLAIGYVLSNLNTK